ncbi:MULTISPECIES: glycosyltransferase family 2 protein [Citrobacter]|uniref:glycosyltransferase family 2 protein n=1 Tax=Citrobacter TaxID=544 RepID=UPI002163F2AB|nr:MULTISPECIES: glycosyltransferase family 2 protein [Citrobacter]MCS0534317.1 glycosyltransferase [Citrobacter portucalensis]MCX9066864.1 glycosyltransferase [Citrobacter portucalensis]MDM2887979.1 glycosyltransferase [Citrobacter sp. Cpo045]MDM2915301.1 glycosyltransferase [Citrobacter sp. Cpo035]MDV1610555.1 glycosyltransferase family 2 protein [Citrobacter portucalensis]
MAGVNIVRESVSIIMPAFNASPYIYESISSVLQQSYQDWHLYVIDDASTDNTVQIVSSFNDSRITLIRLKTNSGVARARNIGIESCKGQYIAFLDSDDFWESNKLSLQVPLLEKGYDVVCSNYVIFIHDPKNIVGTRYCPSKISYSRMLRGNCIGNLTGIYNQKKLEKCLQKECGHEDYLMWLELLRRSGSAVCIQQVLARYRVGDNSLSANKLKAACWQWNIYRKQLKMCFLKSSYYWCYYAISALLRSLK